MSTDLPEDGWLRRERQRIGRCIRVAREDAGLTQEKVFLAVGMNRSHYQQIESGDANPTLNALLRIARAIGVTIGDLLQ